jgi:hypothetical protein
VLPGGAGQALLRRLPRRKFYGVQIVKPGDPRAAR